MAYKNFYEAFEDACNHLLVIGSYVSENQKISVKHNADFLNHIGKENYKKAASDLAHALSMYNLALDQQLYYVDQTQEKSRKTKDKKIIEKFIKLLYDEKISMRLEDARLIRENLKKLVPLFLQYFEDDQECTKYIKQKRPIKTGLKKTIYAICDKYGISRGRKVKRFIDYIDEPYDF